MFPQLLRSHLGVLVLAFGAVGCSTFAIRSDQCPAYPGPLRQSVSADDVKVQYLGVGGYLVQRGEDVVLFGPVYSNPSLVEVLFDHQIQTDRALVDRLLPADAAAAQAIVVGHSHYDHLMDTPYIANNRATKASIYGSATTAALLASAIAPDRIVDVAAAPRDPTDQTGKGIRIGPRMRLRPIRSRHSDQFRVAVPFVGATLPFHVWRGEVTEPRSMLPARASEWAEGEVYAFLLDFLDDSDRVVFRVYYQDSGTDADVGFPWGPDGPGDDRPVDVALLCLGGDFRHLTLHPEAIIARTRPRYVLLGHWENFFVTQDEICRTDRVEEIPLQDTAAFVRRATAAMKMAQLPGGPILPCPTASIFQFPTDRQNDEAVYRALRRDQATYDCTRLSVRRD
jgi:hypothetical protein